MNYNMKKNKIKELGIHTILESAPTNPPNFSSSTSVRNINYSVVNNTINSHINSFNNFSGNGNGNTIINLQEKNNSILRDLENDVIKLKQRLNALRDE